MFKKRNIEKKVNNTLIDDIHVEDDGEDAGLTVPKVSLSRKINKFSTKKEKQQPKATKISEPLKIKYGLIDKDEVNAKYHSVNQQEEQNRKKQAEPNSLVDMYIKKKLEERAPNQTSAVSNLPNPQAPTSSAPQILQLQRQYLSSQQKLSEYNVDEMQNKLQQLSTSIIKNQTEARNAYLKKLLESEHEKTEYASKKELKAMRQQKERLQEEFRNKYQDHGRRHYVQQMKYEAMLGK